MRISNTVIWALASIVLASTNAFAQVMVPIEISNAAITSGTLKKYAVSFETRSPTGKFVTMGQITCTVFAGGKIVASGSDLIMGVPAKGKGAGIIELNDPLAPIETVDKITCSGGGMAQ